MLIEISDVVAYRSVSLILVITWAPFWSLLGPRLGHYLGLVCVILCFVINVLYNDVPTGTYCSVSHYPFPLENASISLRLYIYTLLCYQCPVQ